MGATPSPGLQNYPLQLWDWFFGAKEPIKDNETHLLAALSWLCAAQDASTDRGVARMYHIRDGWGPSYPETTGYLIPTLIRVGKHLGKSDLVDRALQMADWESEIQMSSGAVQGGVLGDPQTPAIFNTGQVLFGWVAAFNESKNGTYRESAIAAADYLLAQQDEDGAWRSNLSEYCESPDDTYAFNVRSAWALMIAANAFERPDYMSAALANVAFVRKLIQANGWIAKNCLNRPEQPLLHTIAYFHQGLLECAQLSNDESGLIEQIVIGNERLLDALNSSNRMYGRYTNEWVPTVHWRCLTGEAQTAIVWQRLSKITGDTKWATGAARLGEGLKATQRLTGKPERMGGIQGSHPITGPYGRMEYLNWATKFFVDYLLLDMGVADAATDG